MRIEQITVGPLQSNCYIAANDAGDALIIDPGWDAGRIQARIEDMGVTPVRIVNTHCHFDHVMAAGEIQSAFDIPFWIPAGEEELLARAPDIARQWLDVEGGTVPTPDRLIGEGVEIGLEGVTFTVRETPGHSPGGCTFVGEGICFSGDTVFAGSIGRYDFPDADFNTLMQSIKRVYLPLPDETTLYPGHGPATTMGQERRTNQFIRALLQRGE